MANLIEHLRRFNRKERFYLIGLAFGNPEFVISEWLRERLNETFKLDISPYAFCGMDYHIDWLYGSLVLAFQDDAKDVGPQNIPGVGAEKRLLISAGVQDVDFILAYHDGERWHIVLVEAKGVLGWQSDQLRSKAIRLKAIFGDDGKLWPEVTPHFAIVSPVSPEKTKELDCSAWPTWMKKCDGKARWLPMPFPSGLEKITRCNEAGRVTAAGPCWMVVRDKLPGIAQATRNT